MKASVFVAGTLLLCVALGCGSDDSDSEGSAGSAGSAGKSSNNSAGSKATAGASATGGSKGNGAAGSSGTTTQAGSAGSSSTASSAECQKYCECHEQNCASSPIPDGKSCAEFCAGFTADQMECRQIHCILAPEQPDNDHCTHSLGIIQCL